MKSAKKKQLERKGWKVGTVAQFLQLSPEESAYIEMKLALSKNLQERRKNKCLNINLFIDQIILGRPPSFL